MAVNLSPWQLKNPDLVEKVRDVLATSGIDPALLTLEITETALVEESHATLARLRELKALGVRLSIDDFGTGYSSLSYLRQFPMDGVKIAKPFVDHVADGADDSALARAIITIGETLELEVIAEGIEHEEQMRVLPEAGLQARPGVLLLASIARRGALRAAAELRSPSELSQTGQAGQLGQGPHRKWLECRHGPEGPHRQSVVVDALVVFREEVEQAWPQAAPVALGRLDVQGERHDGLLPEVVGITIGPREQLEPHLHVESLGPQPVVHVGVEHQVGGSLAVRSLVPGLHEQSRQHGPAKVGRDREPGELDEALVVAVAIEHAAPLQRQAEWSVGDGAHAAHHLPRAIVGRVLGRVAIELVDEDVSPAILARQPAELLDEDAVAKGVQLAAALAASVTRTMRIDRTPS